MTPEPAALLAFDPLPMEQYEGLSDRERRLQCIGDVIGYWLKWVTGEREAEGLPTTADTHVMFGYTNAPPEWPSVGQLTHWLSAIRDIPLTSQTEGEVTAEMESAGCKASNIPCAPSNRALVTRIYLAMRSASHDRKG